ncbi:MAG: uroporphyrinogen decarboxylase family protein [Bacteroidetes bacterium]|nr:uroporphyrinogen decarboxylase family protein [Bacteroidota bacterium]MCL5025496.1 uroporphyrinogen decarboxylase family protein [Chloroflexota bacterium]
MNERERFTAVLRGEVPDRLPWVARLELWYEFHSANGSLPERYRGWSMWDIQRDIGMGILARSDYYRKKLQGVEVVTRDRGNERLVEYRTPVGTVSTRHVIGSDAAPLNAGGKAPGAYWYETEHMIKRVEDYAVVEYIYEHTLVEPNYEDIISKAERLHGDGYPLPYGADRVPIQDILIQLIGYNDVYFELADHLPQLERLLGVISDYHRQRLWPVALEAPTELVAIRANLTGLMTSPAIFERYFAPYTRELSALLHKRGKKLATHMDGEPGQLLRSIRGSGLDVIEAFTPAPMTGTTTGQARAAYGPGVIIWGGVPSAILCPDLATDEEFEAHMSKLFREIAPGHAFILGVGDNTMPQASLERVKRVGELVRERGKLPIPTSS